MIVPYFDGFVRWLGIVTLFLITWRSLLSIYRRLIQKPKKPESYGKWAIVTGSTSGIGKEFAEYLAKKGMNIMLISRTEKSLQDQAKLITSQFGVKATYLAYDFTASGTEKDKFYQETLTSEVEKLNVDGGVGLLVNNVGTANLYPTALDEFKQKELDDMINCNIFSTLYMTQAVLPGMKKRKSGCVISISSGSGNWCSPFLVVYSATKAFMTQFTRSMHIECWDTGVDFYVACPFYVETQLCKRKAGWSLDSPIKPIQLVEGVMAQIGKRYVWQGNGFWLHGFLQIAGFYTFSSVGNNWKRMLEKRRRYQDKVAKSSAEKKAE